jgi:heptosyltransferase-1
MHFLFLLGEDVEGHTQMLMIAPVNISSRPRILIVRLSAIGDVIMSTSVLPGIRARYPEAHITWLTEPVGAEILDGNPMVDEVIVWPRGKWVKELKAKRYGAVLSQARKLVKQLRRADFDLAVDMQGILKSAAWAFLSGAPKRISLRGREQSSLLMTETVREPVSFGGKLCMEYRVLAEHMELPMEVFGMHLKPLPDRVEWAASLMGSKPGRPVLLFPFTTRPQKHWFDDRWSELAARLHALGETSVWILGGPGDEAAAKVIAERSGVPVGIVAGTSTGMREKLALVGEAALCIGVDTGLTHLGFGLHRPTIALFGSTCAYRDTGERPGTVLYTARDCSPCRRHPTCEGRFDCMRDHTVERVMDAAKKWLGTSR